MKFRVLFLLCIFSFLMAGCSTLTPPTPTPTPSPTETPTAVPTATTAPTRSSPTATKENALPPAIAFALNKTQGANSMKFEFESAVTRVENGAPKKVPGLALKGFDSTLNRNVTISGTTSDTNEFIVYDVVIVGEDVFIKGLAGVPAVDAAQWYQLPQQAQAGVRRLPTARGLIASFSPETVSKAQFQATGNETLNAENCSVWAAQNPTFAQTLIGVTDDSDLKKQLGEIDATEFRVWTCADGYIHLMTGSVQGHVAQNKENKVTVTLRLAMSDFNSASEIQAPANPKPFPIQQQEPTPAATNPTNSTSVPTGTPNASPSASAETPNAAPSPTP